MVTNVLRSLKGVFLCARGHGRHLPTYTPAPPQNPITLNHLIAENRGLWQLLDLTVQELEAPLMDAFAKRKFFRELENFWKFILRMNETWPFLNCRKNFLFTIS